MSPKRLVKVFDCKDHDGLDVIARLIEDFVETEQAFILSIQHIEGTDQFLVLYEIQTHAIKTPASEPEAKAPEPPTNDVAFTPAAKSPLVDGFFRDERGNQKAVKVMAGVFPVQEGMTLHPEDTIPAPNVLMAPGVDLSQYQNMIFNTGEADG